MAHAYFLVGESEQGIESARAFAKNELEISGKGDPDIVVLQYTLFSVEESRKLLDIACAAPLMGTRKAIIVCATRFFHEAQNALLKLFEEPPPGITFILIIPSEGMLLPTLRSRLASLTQTRHPSDTDTSEETTRQFLAANPAERAKLLEKLVTRSKSDKDEEKQRARSDAVGLVEDLMRASRYAHKEAKGTERQHELQLFENDLMRFLPLLYTRSAPLKLIFEHLLIVIPTSLNRAKV